VRCKYARRKSREGRILLLTIVVITINISHMPRTRATAGKARAPEAQLEAEVFVNLFRTADALARGAESLLKSAGLSAAQYNVLRILRGAGAEGLACSEIGCRMISRDPDITRLLDRMESRGLIARARKRRPPRRKDAHHIRRSAGSGEARCSRPRTAPPPTASHSCKGIAAIVAPIGAGAHNGGISVLVGLNFGLTKLL
jgi:DNA-binding MarR family transcriptional regulator